MATQLQLLMSRQIAASVSTCSCFYSRITYFEVSLFWFYIFDLLIDKLLINDIDNGIRIAKFLSIPTRNEEQICVKKAKQTKMVVLEIKHILVFKKNHLHIYVYTGGDRTALLEGKWYDARSMGSFGFRRDEQR